MNKLIIEYESPLDSIEETDQNVESIKIAKAIEAVLLQQALLQISNISNSIQTIVNYGQKVEDLIQNSKE